MSKYSCRCPAPGCESKAVVEADDWEGAFKKLFEMGNRHIFENHPDFPVAENPEEEARKFVRKNMKRI
jgi:hypothetical protein